MKIKKVNHILFLILSFLSLICHMRLYFHLPYRQTEGIIKTNGKNLLPVHPGYSHICGSRVNKLDIQSKRLDNDDNDNDNDNDGIIIALDSKGIKVTNRDQWMQEKW